MRKKKKKSKSKKDKRKSRRKASEVEQQYESDIPHRSTIFPSLSPPSMSKSRPDINLATGEYYGDGVIDNEIDPNDDIPSFTKAKSRQWNPASLVTAAHANDKVYRNGFYKNMKEHAGLAYGRVQSLKSGRQNVIGNEYNLKNIGKARDMTYQPAPRSRNIVWGDESILTNDASTVGPGSGEKATRRTDEGDEDSSSDLKQSMEHYLENEQRVQKLMREKKRRCVGGFLLATMILIGTFLAIYLTRSGKESSFPPPTSTQPGVDSVDRNDPPPRPLPSPPTDSIDQIEGSISHVITETELRYIVNTITPDESIFDNPHSPQSKALRWFKNDMQTYNATTSARVAQRYALATLYYSTNGTGWQTRSQWGSGRECNWFGVGCEAGGNDTASVTYLDLNSNLLDGTIPPEIGFILTLEQSK